MNPSEKPKLPRLTPELAASLRMGDTVYHHSSGETWVLRWVKGDRLSWLGWPPGEAKVSDCSLVARCADAIHLAWAAVARRPGTAAQEMDRDQPATA